MDDLIRSLHGGAALGVMLLFFYQAALGLNNRSKRKKGHYAEAADTIRIHRRNGRILVPLLALVFAGGLIVNYIDANFLGGRSMSSHIPHGVNGALLLITAFAAWRVSRRIGGARDSRTRNIHMALGLAVITLYVLQAALGLTILLRYFNQ